ncbi:MAG: hypothetical protein L3J46_07795 [Kangiellaceae bacterium]|nr:hypothetical protein [Kangiellaceae bacterium]
MKTNLIILGIISLVLLSIHLTATATQAKKPSACSSDQHRAFDFWVGEWEVSARGKKQSHAKSYITKSNNGCSIHERYETTNGYTGNSINFYDTANKKWHQTWIDIQGSPLYLEGGFSNGAMILSDKTNRITWTINDGKEVNQVWETTKDNGKNWTVIFDGIYRTIKTK